MAKLSDIQIKHETRICQVEHEVGLFHCWEQYMTGGQIAQVYGIVEFTNDVRRVDPSKIMFIDETNNWLHTFAKLKALKEKKDET